MDDKTELTLDRYEQVTKFFRSKFLRTTLYFVLGKITIKEAADRYMGRDIVENNEFQFSEKYNFVIDDITIAQFRDCAEASSEDDINLLSELFSGMYETLDKVKMFFNAYYIGAKGMPLCLGSKLSAFEVEKLIMKKLWFTIKSFYQPVTVTIELFNISTEEFEKLYDNVWLEERLNTISDIVCELKMLES